MTILIIEDDDGLAELIREKIGENGYKTDCVYSANDALKWLSSDTPYIMLLDYSLPDLNAREFIAELKRKEHPVPPFIISTGMGDEKIAVEMMKLGARDYIVKDNFFLDMLPEVLRRVEREIENEDKRKLAEKLLKESEEKYRVLFSNEIYAICIFDLETLKLLDVNEAYTHLYGYTNKELLSGMTIHDITAEMAATDVSTDQATKDGTVYIPLRYHRKKDGTVFPVEIVGGPYEWKGRRVMFALAHDITERIFAEEKIKSLLAEKELILKEVHHRIKNNMNTIKSLLFLQADTLKDPSGVAALQDAESRVESMMILYDKLYKSSDFKELSIKEYLSELVDEIIGNFPNKGIVKFEKEIDDFIIKTDILFPLGILVNELLTNIMKYAFSERDSGLIAFSVSIEDTHVKLIIKDNGIGIPESIDFNKNSGFGMQLVAMLTEQIGGIIRIERGEGSKFVLEFDV